MIECDDCGETYAAYEEPPNLLPLKNGFARLCPQCLLFAAEIEIERLQAEVERLQEERRSLPHFADDVIAYPGMESWRPDEDTPGIVNSGGWTCGNEEWGAETCECFSTREAAEAAEGD